MQKCRLFVAAMLASVSFAASADRADRRDEHYFWEKRDAVLTATSAPAGEVGQFPHAQGRPLAFGERGFQFVIGPSTRSRAEVIAELHEARRLGLITHGEADPQVPTALQKARIEAAGRAASAARLSSR
jgi:hypothetical protein